MVKNSPVNAGDIRDAGSIPGWGRSPGEGNGNPLQYSCLETPMDRRAWWATVQRVTKSRTQLKQLSMHTQVFLAVSGLSPVAVSGVCSLVVVHGLLIMMASLFVEHRL